jgi:phosphohistidine phosphatase
MNLYFLRHGIAVARGTPGYETDGDRPLTQEGEKKTQRIARGMQSLELTFDLVLSSPFVRARRTAEIVVEIFGSEGKLEFTRNLEPGGNPQDLVRELRSRTQALESVLLVGHEPYLSSLISVLLTGDEQTSVVLKKAGLCCLVTDDLEYGRCARLEFLLAPGHLSRIR